MNIFVFDIETVPDVQSGRRIHDFHDISDDDVAQAMFKLRREQTGSEFLRLHLHRVVAISIVFRHGDTVKVWSLGDEQADEKEIVQRFFDGIDRYTPTLVSWNGGGFDLPVLHYRALLHGITAERYWENGDQDNSFRWNNYLSRFHARHTDLMDVIAGYQPRANAPLDEIATMLGFPGKMGMDGSKVWPTYQRGDIKAIRDYCETDVLNTYLVYLRFEVIRGNLTEAEYQEEADLLENVLRDSGAEHLTAFADAWRTDS